jgi:hypothetical protein
VLLIANLLSIVANRAGIAIASQLSSHLLFGFIADLRDAGMWNCFTRGSEVIPIDQLIPR